MAYNESLKGDCLAPFYDAALFGHDDRFTTGRFCAPVPLPGRPTCCLPCPAAEWTYSDSFTTYANVAQWLNVIGLILLVFMLVSHVVLPTTQTRSHYLSVCLILSVLFICIGFTIPLASQPEQCYDEITPNDMYSSDTCAWNGAFIIAGGLSATMWIFIRALSMNLQICWDIVPGKKFFYAAQAFGWGIPAVLFAASLTLTGLSYHFGNACLLNHKNSMADFWGPLLGIAGAAGLLQLATFGYCIHVYLKNLWSDQSQESSAASGSGLPSYNSSVRNQTARAVWRRLKKVLWLQWRGICIVSIILIDVIFFSIVFVYLDSIQMSVKNDWQKVEPWLLCLAAHPTDKNQCLHLVSPWLVSEATVVAVLILLSLAGIQVFLFLTRPSIFPAWKEFFMGKLHPHRQEFVSLDARQKDLERSNSMNGLLRYDHVRGHQSTTFEMQQPGMKTMELEIFDADSKSPTVLSSPEDAYQTPLQHPYSSPVLTSDIRGNSPSLDAIGKSRTIASTYGSQMTPDLSSGLTSPSATYNGVNVQQQPQDYFSQYQRRAYSRQDSSDSLAGERQQSGPHHRSLSQERRYQPPSASFSAPKTPSRQSSVRSAMFAETRDAYGRGGLGLNPPSEAGESQEDLTHTHARRNFDRR
ncbi:hypothetical protein KC333_g7818 [Hortaea werneckii]|nr:hypothetical protein KC333_g7818 [Hortaea werneckii]KAI7311179.1 hypothetical protein KC326_g6395 [Hortaea werneckii]